LLALARDPVAVPVEAVVVVTDDRDRPLHVVGPVARAGKAGIRVFF